MIKEEKKSLDFEGFRREYYATIINTFRDFIHNIENYSRFKSNL